MSTRIQVRQSASPRRGSRDLQTHLEWRPMSPFKRQKLFECGASGAKGIVCVREQILDLVLRQARILNRVSRLTADQLVVPPDLSNAYLV